MTKINKKPIKDILKKVAKKLQTSNKESKFHDDSRRQFMVDVIPLLDKSESKQDLLKTLKKEELAKFPKHKILDFQNMVDGLKEGHPNMSPKLRRLIQSIRSEDLSSTWES